MKTGTAVQHCPWVKDVVRAIARIRVRAIARIRVRVRARIRVRVRSVLQRCSISVRVRLRVRVRVGVGRVRGALQRCPALPLG